MTPRWDLLLKNVRVVRPGERVVHNADIAIRDGKFSSIGPSLDAGNAKSVYDGKGRLDRKSVV